MSRFVPAGASQQDPPENDEWEKASKDIEDSKIRKEADGKQEGGKSLFDVLQANKAAKQEAFEESIKLKNQFRALDEDEVDFLDNILESTRAKDEMVQRETVEQLEAFRQRRENMDKAARQAEDEAAEEEQWAAVSRKRKKTKDREALKGVKRRKSSDAQQLPMAAPKANIVDRGGEQVGDDGESRDRKKDGGARADAPATSAKPLDLGLGAYSSDDDEENS